MTAIARTVALCALAVALLALCGAALPALAATAPRASIPSGITMTVRAGYGFGGGGNYRLNGPTLLHANDVWVPVHIALRNAGNSNVDGRLVISDNGSQTLNNAPTSPADYTLDVTLPAGARKLVEMYVRAADLGGISELSVNLMVDGRLAASGNTIPSIQPAGVLSVGILSNDPAARVLFHNLKFGDTGLSVAQFDETLNPVDPQAQALQNFDLIVVTNYSSDTLSSAQLAALEAWVQGGGTLLVAGGPDAQKTMGHLPDNLLAATLNSSGQTTAIAPSLPELAQLAGQPGGAGGPVEYSVASPRPGGTVLAAHNGVPLAVDLPLGRGHLVYSALEPTLAPFNNWPLGAQGAFWSRLLGGALAGPLDTLVEVNAQNSNPGATGAPATNITTDLGTPPSRSLPSVQVYAFLIVLYILVLGPANFLVLRGLRRLELSWVTVPVIAVLFGAASFGVAYARNGGDVLTNIDTVVYLDPGSPTKLADSYIGIFAPYQADYTLSSPSPALAWGLATDNGSAPPANSAPMRLDEGPQFNAWLYGVQMWSMRSLGVRQQVTLPGQVTGNLVLHGGVVSGAVTNETNVTLYDCAIVGADGNSDTIHAIAPGQTVQIKPFALSNASAATPANGGGPLTNLYAGLVTAGFGHLAAGPGTLVSPSRYSTILSALFPTGSIATAATPLSLIGWSTRPVSRFSVNGATPRRADLDLFIAPLTLGTAPGRIVLAPGALPVSVVGTTVQPGPGTQGSINLNPGDHLDVQLALPGGGSRLRVGSLSVVLSGSDGSSLSSSVTQLWNWQTGRWVNIDLSTGSWTHNQAGAFVSPNGLVRLRFAASSSGDVTFGNISQSVEIGATYMVG